MVFLPDKIARLCESYHADSPGRGVKSMAALAGVGDSPVCDFYAPLGGVMLVIEEKNLVTWVKGRMGRNSEEAIVREFAGQCKRKAKGSADILKRLYAKFIAAKGGRKNPRQADCEFWVVVTDLDSQNEEGDIIAYNAVIDAVPEMMRGVSNAELSRPFVFFDIAVAGKFGRRLTRKTGK